jgi:dynein light chain LC8-type
MVPPHTNLTKNTPYSIKATDMTEDMQAEVITVATDAVKLHQQARDIAASIKKEFDARHGPTWHAVVGQDFGSYVTHEARHFIYFYVNKLGVLLFKSG